MTQPLTVYLDAMSRYASAMEDLSSQLASTRRALVDADVTGDSFGLLPESREVATAYEQRTTDGLDVLGSGADVFTDVGEAFTQMRDNYREADEGNADQFRAGR